MLIPRIPLAALAIALALAGCGGCKGKDQAPAATATAFLPAQPAGAVWVPDLAKVGETVAALEKTKLAELAASAAGARGTDDFVRPVIHQLGFDPRSPEGFAKAGIDGKKGLAIAQEPAGARVLVVGVADEGKLTGYVASLAKRLGGTVKGEAVYTGPADQPVKIPVTTFGTADGKVRLAYGLRGGYAIVATDEGASDAVGRALSRAQDQSLGTSAAFRKITEKLGRRDVYVWMPKGAKLSPRDVRNSFKEGLAVGLAATPAGVNARVLLPRGPLELAVLHPAGKVAGGALVPLLPPQHFLALRLGGEPQALQPILEGMLPRQIFSRLRKAGIDPSAEILAQLQPGVVVGMGLAPEIDLSGGLPQEVSVSRTNPFQFVNVVAYAKVKDPARAAAVLEKLAAATEHFAMKISSEEVEGARVYQASYSAGDGMTWGLVGDTLIATGGKGLFAEARKRLSAPQPAFAIQEPSARQVFDTSASAAHLDMPRLTAALRAIPESAFGIGGFRLKAIMDTWTTLLDEVKGVTASFSVDDQGLVIDADLGLK